MWGSYYKIPKAIFYLLKGDYRAQLLPLACEDMEGAILLPDPDKDPTVSLKKFLGHTSLICQMTYQLKDPIAPPLPTSDAGTLIFDSCVSQFLFL